MELILRREPDSPNDASATRWWQGSRSRLPLVVIAFFCFSSYLAFRLNVWQDEAYTLHTTGAGFAYAVTQGTFFEAQAPLYFPVLELWRTLDKSIFFARLLSIAASLVTISVSYRFAKRYVRSVRPELVALVVAFNPFVIWASVEARPYALALALSTALLYTLFRGWYDDDADMRARIAFVVLAIVAAYTQYYVTTIVAAGALMLGGCARAKRLPGYLLACLVVLVGIAPIALIVPRQMTAYSSAIYIGNHLPPLGVFQILPDFIFPRRFVGSWTHDVAKNLFYVLIALVPIVLAVRSVKMFSGTFRALAILTLALCEIFALFVLAHVPIVWPRQTAVVFAPTILAVFALADGVATNRRRSLAIAFVAAYGLLTSFSLFSDYHALAKPGDWQRVGAYLRANVGSDDAVAVFDLEATLPLSYYFKAPIVAIPRPLSFGRFSENDYVVHDEAEVRSSLGVAAAGRKHVWLVRNDICKTSAVFYGCRFVDSYVAKHFSVGKRAAFAGSSVEELVPKLPAR